MSFSPTLDLVVGFRSSLCAALSKLTMTDAYDNDVESIWSVHTALVDSTVYTEST